jgi:hypothetical protein
MIIDNLRLGGYGFSGSRSESSTTFPVVGDNTNSLNNEVEYSIGGGAFTIEYTMPFIKNIAVSAGVMLGGGAIEIEAYQNSTNPNWNAIWDQLYQGSNTIDKQLSMNSSFFFMSPTLNVDFPITRFLALRGGLGYQFTFGSDWEIANGKTISGVPSGLSADGFFIQTGLLIGLFAF